MLKSVSLSTVLSRLKWPYKVQSEVTHTKDSWKVPGICCGLLYGQVLAKQIKIYCVFFNTVLIPKPISQIKMGERAEVKMD